MKYLIGIAGFILLLFNHTEAQVSLRLLVNYSYTDTISAGEPVLLELQLYNTEAEYATIHNTAVRRNLEILEQENSQGKWTQEEYDEEREILENSIKPVVPVTIPGHALLSGLYILLDEVPLGYNNYIRCTAYPEQDDYTLTDNVRLTMLFGIPPEKTAQWVIGSHTVRVIVDSLSTDTAHLVIAPVLNDTEPADIKFIRLGYFYLDCGDPTEALIIADRLLSTTPDFLDAVTLKADAYLVMEDNDQALEWYKKALGLFHLQNPNSYELPEYLLSQIAALQE
ncbi:MAG TPA: hypothetical protein VI603_07375 [Saprospiraceae bacterium]|nr:hypothetical protein [Saprospiraceae bacterium]